MLNEIAELEKLAAKARRKMDIARSETGYARAARAWLSYTEDLRVLRAGAR